MPKEKDKPTIRIHSNEELPILFVDNLVVTERNDGMYFVRFLTVLPEGLKEQSRMIIPKNSLVRMLDVLCKQCGHFPAKQE